MITFLIKDGRASFFQWDENRQITVVGDCNEVHFCHSGDEAVLTVSVTDGIANVPSILLEQARTLLVYAFDADHTLQAPTSFKVIPRPMPEDYVPDDLVPKWSELEGRIESLEGNEHTHENKTILNEITAAYTEEEKTKLDGIDLSGYQPALTFDSTPTDGSTNPVTSNGVYDALHPTYELIEKIIVGYSLTTSQPADWLTNWTSYYTNTGTAVSPVYTAVGGASAPTWAEKTYYNYSAGGVAAIDRTAEPTGTPYDFSDVKIKAKTLPNSAGTASLFSRAYVSDTNFIEGYTGNGVSTTLTWYYYHRFFVDGGYWNGFFSTNTSAYSGYPAVGVYASFDKQNAYNIAAYPTIKRIKLLTYPGTINMLGGCEYEIWGVRA